MRLEDIDAVLEIQLKCYDSAKQESSASFLSKMGASPDTSFVARLGQKTVGYLVSMPAVAAGPMPLNSQAYSRPSDPDALYLHDLAVDQEARGAGVAAVLVETYLRKLRETRLPCGTLTAVNDSSRFWQRHGFREITPIGLGSEHLATYGQDARYMHLELAQHG